MLIVRFIDRKHTGLAKAIELVSESGDGFEMQRLLFGQNVCGDGFADLLVDIGEIGAFLAHEPLLTGSAGLAVR